MAKHLGYYDNWKSEPLRCPQCGWTGTFEEGSVECHREWMDSSCPACDNFPAPILAVVSFPSTEQSEANWDKLSKSEKDEVKAHKRFHAAWKKSSLKSAAELPDLEGSSLTLTWDFAEKGSKKFTVITHGEEEIWRERALFEGFERFEEVAKLLIEKYGVRLADVVPTPASEIYLYGDVLSAPDAVEAVRKSIKESHRA